ncbi:ankyrin repeat-containing domain protein [Mycena vulgaris]|nr:ankyrin repeat-containing domain protein [Mycena vulgaris]
MQKGADPNLWTGDTRFGNTLQLVVFYGKIELAEFLLDKKIQDTPGGDYGTALQAASARGHFPIVELFLQTVEYREGLNAVGGDYGTALCAACASGKVEVVNALLQAGAMRNGDGKHFGAPLHVAVLMEDRDMVKLLIGDNPNAADCTWEGVGTAVDIAGFLQNEDMFALLREKGLRSVIRKCRRIARAC